MKKETVGKVSSDLLNKKIDKVDVVEQQKGMNEDYLKNLTECVETHIDSFEGSFYVVVVTKAERLMPNVFRNYFLARNTCPTPENDQSVFRYNDKLGRVEYLWTVPSEQSCSYLVENESQLPTEELQLLQFVKMFLDDSLFQLSKKMNGEEVDTPFLA